LVFVVSLAEACHAVPELEIEGLCRVDHGDFEIDFLETETPIVFFRRVHQLRTDALATMLGQDVNRHDVSHMLLDAGDEEARDLLGNFNVFFEAVPVLFTIIRNPHITFSQRRVEIRPVPAHGFVKADGLDLVHPRQFFSSERIADDDHAD
jgi:hypothetical protein